MDYEIINYDEKYDDEIYEFQKQLWTADFNLNKNYFRWKYIENPVSDSPKIYLVLSAGKLIAFRGMHDMHWQIGGTPNRFIALSSTDLHIHQDYRNKGIYTNLMNFVLRDLNEKGYRYIFNFSAGNVNYINSLAMGWKSIGRIKVLNKTYPRKELSTVTIAKKILRKIGVSEIIKKIIHIPKPMDRLSGESLTEPHPRIRVENKPKPKEMAALVKNLIPTNKITLNRDETYFRWRYNNPISKYIFLYLYDDNLKGYLVLGNQELFLGHDDTLNIFELEATTSSTKVELLNHLLKIMDYGKISVWERMLDQDSLDYLISQEFTDGNLRKSVKDHAQTILIKSLDKDNRFEYQGLDLLDSHNWDLKMTYLHDF